ncbi:MAG: Asp23/Gls24 family envelope stress response protein [Chloroflexi bacterium]|jgi:uncharacterized alkaline shock family protein YloU|nr:Asp23/Gls24 family envelope stress response protein [Chloroflexota bacterium]
MDKNLGKTTIAPSVLITIARLTTLSVPGVSRLSESKSIPDGVKIEIKDDLIDLDLFVIISSDQNARLVAEEIQKRVNRAITEMVGMEVAKIDVHITDVDVEV